MINALATLLGFQLLGTALAFVLHVPVPGPVLGMALLLAWLMASDRSAQALRPTALGLLQHLSLLFVPAGVGVMLHLTRIAHEWLAISVALLASTALAIVVTALVIEHSRRWLDIEDDAGTR